MVASTGSTTRAEDTGPHRLICVARYLSTSAISRCALGAGYSASTPTPRDAGSTENTSAASIPIIPGESARWKNPATSEEWARGNRMRLARGSCPPTWTSAMDPPRPSRSSSRRRLKAAGPHRAKPRPFAEVPGWLSRTASGPLPGCWTHSVQPPSPCSTTRLSKSSTSSPLNPFQPPGSHVRTHCLVHRRPLAQERYPQCEIRHSSWIQASAHCPP